MTREWVETANKKRREEAEALDKQIVSLISDSVLLDEEDKKIVLEEYIKSKNIGVNLLQYGIRWKIFDKHKTEFANVAEKDKLLITESKIFYDIEKRLHSSISGCLAD